MIYCYLRKKGANTYKELFPEDDVLIADGIDRFLV